MQICTFLESCNTFASGEKTAKSLTSSAHGQKLSFCIGNNNLQCACFGHFFLSLWPDGSTSAKQHLLAKCPGTNGPMGITGGKQ